MRVGTVNTSRTQTYLARGSTRNVGEFPGKLLTEIARSISSTRVRGGTWKVPYARIHRELSGGHNWERSEVLKRAARLLP